MTPRRIGPDSRDIPHILDLIRRSFAYMDGRIDPPSSMHRLSEGVIREQTVTGEVWVIGTPVIACVFLTPKPDHLYLGKPAVDEKMRGHGLARDLFAVADLRARAHGLPGIKLESRVELTENHAIFVRSGYRKIGDTAHPGYDRPTSFTFWKDVTAD